MKRSTHVVLGAGSAATAAGLLGCSPACWLVAVTAAAVANVLVDVFGHEKRFWRAPRRTRASHSIPGMLLFSAATAAPLAAYLGGEEPLLAVAAAMVGGMSHWAADLVTPAGVYLYRRRVRLGLARYDSLVANAVFTIIGILLLAYGVLLAVEAAGY